MDKLRVGDSVKVGPKRFSKVFMFTHKVSGGAHEFVEITSESGRSVSLSEGHFMPVNGALMPASGVRIGDSISVGDGRTERVVIVRKTSGTGLFNPQTLHGEIVVNGIVASTYTSAVWPPLAHAALLPIRSVFSITGFTLGVLERGGGIFSGLLPVTVTAF
jgi:hypothetical protein